VPVPAFLRDALTEHVAGRTGLVFPDARGQHLRGSNFLRRVWYPALESARLPRITVHELRHTAASLAIGSGADVKVVQRMLGHQSAAMTLDVYGHLLEDRLDEVADALDAVGRAAETAHRRHRSPVRSSTCRKVVE